MAIAANIVWDFGERHGELMILRGQFLRDAGQAGEIIVTQLAFHPALGRVAEQVKLRAAQALELRHQLEDLEHPRAKMLLLGVPVCIGL